MNSIRMCFLEFYDKIFQLLCRNNVLQQPIIIKKIQKKLRNIFFKTFCGYSLSTKEHFTAVIKTTA
jgi:hypothetical protein